MDIWKKNTITKPVAVVQLAHGMAEHILRYEQFASYLVNKGFIVIGNDHRGHGRNIIAPDDKGFFADEHGFHRVVQDAMELTDYVKETYPNVPLFLFGHSMGSFIIRRHIQLYNKQLDGVIICGSGARKGIAGKIGKYIARLECKRIGKRTPSKLMNYLIFGKFNNQFTDCKTDFDFLSSDEEAVQKYISDPYCGFICSSKFYDDLLSGIEIIHKRKELIKTPKNLPLYFISGDKDPVGNNGKDIEKLYNIHNKLGFKQMNTTIYPNARHELLHEINRDSIYKDIYVWIQGILLKEGKNEKN